MYSILRDLLSDRKGGATFNCFDGWHLCWIVAVFTVILELWFGLKNRNDEVKRKAVNICIDVAFGLYLADFFLMPFAYGNIDIEKLPFHICTVMCVLCYLSRHTKFFEKYKLQFAIYGLISNFVYLIYPAGVMWQQVHPLSYRVIQTLLFHGIMTVYGFLVLLFDFQPDWKKWHRDLAVIAAVTLWAMVGNYLYNGEVGEYSHFFNWFFVVRDPFYLMPKDIAPFVMPLLNMGLFFGVNMLIRLVCVSIRKCNQSNGRRCDGV
jgi:hypothetical protein